LGPAETTVTAAAENDLVPRIAAFCGDCHAMPSPGGFPRVAWHKEVKQGYDFYLDSGRSDLSPPPFHEVVAWFRNQAPEEIVLPRQSEPQTPTALRFRETAIYAGADDRNLPPAVSFIRWSALPGDDERSVWWCDMRSGELRAAGPVWKRSSSRLLGAVAHPAHAEPCDLDGDGLVDLVIAELGSFVPADHSEGKVFWMRGAGAAFEEPQPIQAGLGRVADVQPGDFDGDGDTDLIVAEFGWRKTGRIVLLENRGKTANQPEFRIRQIDPRHGTIHVPTTDLDGDGRLDFVALISQEHESVVAFINDGTGGFRKETIFEAREPAFGSSGIQLVDLDRDGDLDVVYTNGDTSDSYYPKPYHSIRWLENRGSFPFIDRCLTAMPGAHRALACDLDGDDDLDIVACALLPQHLLGGQSKTDFDALLWLEQTTPGTFVRHALQRGACEHAALEVGDFDHDGDIDIAVGTFGGEERRQALSIWWNLRIDSDRARDR
jgi:hypothetical protein